MNNNLQARLNERTRDGRGSHEAFFAIYTCLYVEIPIYLVIYNYFKIEFGYLLTIGCLRYH